MNDPYLYLEETNDETLEWIDQHNDTTFRTFRGPVFDSIHDDVYEILAARDHLIAGTKRADFVYNFYTDGDFPRGLWRRTSAESYMAYVSPETEPEWETLLDVGALGRAEDTSWVFQSARLLRPSYDRALITLSPGGSDVSVTREFDLPTRSFVSPDDGGFVTPLSKGSMGWIDHDTVVITADFSEADADGSPSVTESGYPLSARVWRRGTALKNATEIFAGQPTDVLAGASFDTTPGFERLFAFQLTDFRTTILYLVDQDSLELTEIQLPHTSEVGFWHEWALVQLRHDWELGNRSFPAGSLLAVPVDATLRGPTENDVHVLYTPTPTSSFLSLSALKTGLAFTTLDNVQTRVYSAHVNDDGWLVRDVTPDHDDFLTIGIGPVEPDESDDLWVMTNGFLTPTTLSHATVSDTGLEVTKLRSAPERFDSAGLEVRQRWVQSDGGIRVPYFVVGTPDVLDGLRPSRTLLEGYGGFEVSRLPSYLATYGKIWLEKGDVYALANIRGGGEFGPEWHQAALKQHRHKAYEDFAVVARDLVDSRITTVAQLGAHGGSNGGLLMGNMYTTYPELFGALVVRAPLLDMKRYSHMLAGASWVGEYGDPDSEDWEYLQKYSAYHNVTPGPHPPILFTTSSRDDRVHPGHARKMMARLEDMGLEAYYYENTEGGHAGAADLDQQSTVLALMFSFLDQKLG